MARQEPRSGHSDDLRRRAEHKAQADEAKAQETQLSEETRQTLHEPRVHQIELGMQNQELRRAQVELEGDYQ